jgi:hypothetical protein
MKSLLVIAIALVSVSSFAADHKEAKHADKAAVEACKAEKDHAKHEECLKAHAAAPATEAAGTTTAPATAPATKK